MYSLFTSLVFQCTFSQWLIARNVKDRKKINPVPKHPSITPEHTIITRKQRRKYWEKNTSSQGIHTKINLNSVSKIMRNILYIPIQEQNNLILFGLLGVRRTIKNPTYEIKWKYELTAMSVQVCFSRKSNLKVTFLC